MPSPSMGSVLSRPEQAIQLAPLVERARHGDAEAFGRLYDHFHTPVYRAIYGQTNSAPLSEDLTSETFFRALRGIRDYKLDAELFAPWLFRIARNLVIDHFKASRTRLERVQDMSWHEDVAHGADDDVLAMADRALMRAAMDELSVSQRRCIELRFLGELTISETADQLDTTEGAVKQLQIRGLRNLARLLGD